MRINVIPVELLSNVHLRAEFREIIMSIHYFKRSSRKGIDKSKISKSYTLSTGHAYFFFDKFGFILKRFYQLRQEMIKRNFKTDNIDEKFMDLFEEIIPLEMINDYTPTQADLLINVDRILRRILLRPKLYSEKTFIDWCNFYTDELKLPTRTMYDIIRKILDDDSNDLLGTHLNYKLSKNSIQ